MSASFFLRFLPIMTFFSVIFASVISHGLTLDEAISLAKRNLPSYRASLEKQRASEALYRASLSPYLPSLDASFSQGRSFTSGDESRFQTADLTLSYTLFDWGKRKAQRNIARLNLDSSGADVEETLLDLEYAVKSAFYTVQAYKEAVEQRTIQLADAEKDHEVAAGRYQFGVARLSDVLQASVRLEQARFHLVQAQGDLKKALSELNSLIGSPLETDHDTGTIVEPVAALPDFETLVQRSLERPEVKRVEYAIRIEEQSASIIRSTFLPSFSADASYSTIDGDVSRSLAREEKTATVRAVWNIFELGKFYTYRATEFQKNASVETLNELKRAVSLDVRKAYEDMATAQKELEVARTQLQQAEHNYSQAFGEYKVGKGDILALIQAESFLAASREQLVRSKLGVMLSKAVLERVTGMRTCEPPVPDR